MALHIIEVPEHKINVLNEFPKMQGDTPIRGKAYDTLSGKDARLSLSESKLETSGSE